MEFNPDGVLGMEILPEAVAGPDYSGYQGTQHATILSLVALIVFDAGAVRVLLGKSAATYAIPSDSSTTSSKPFTAAAQTPESLPRAS